MPNFSESPKGWLAAAPLAAFSVSAQVGSNPAGHNAEGQSAVLGDVVNEACAAVLSDVILKIYRF